MPAECGKTFEYTDKHVKWLYSNQIGKKDIRNQSATSILFSNK